MVKAARASRACIDEDDIYSVVKRIPVGGTVYSAARGIEKAFTGQNKQSVKSLYDMYGSLVRDLSWFGGPGKVVLPAC